MQRQHWLLALTALLVLGSGCVGILGDDGDADPETISDRVNESLDSMETLQFTMEQTVETDNETRSFRARVVYERPNRINITYLDQAVPYAYAVSNGSVTWLYNESKNEVEIADEAVVEGASEILLGADQLSANATFEGNETLAGEDATELSFAVDGSEVSLLLGGGQETSQFGEASSNGSVETRVWIDTDLWLPRKAQMSVPAFENNRTFTVRYEDIEINPEVSDDEFTFERPADAEVVRGDQSSFRPPRENATFHDSRVAVAENAPFEIPQPTVPNGYEFVEGAVIDGELGQGVELTYRDGEQRLEIVTLRDYDVFFDQGQEVAIGGTTGLYIELPNGRVIQWECDGRLYLISGQEDRDTLVSIGESIGCS